MDLNTQRPLCKEHDNPQVAKSKRLSGSSVSIAAGISGWVPPARPSHSGPYPGALACLGSSKVQLTSSEGDSVVICGHVTEPVDSGLAVVRLRLSPHRTRRGQEWADWAEPGQLWTVRSLFWPQDAGCWPEVRSRRSQTEAAWRVAMGSQPVHPDRTQEANWAASWPLL